VRILSFDGQSSFLFSMLSRCNEELKDKTVGSTRLPYTRLDGEPGHLKIETRLRDERFENVMGEIGVSV
jgi:hypothetical protein